MPELRWSPLVAPAALAAAGAVGAAYQIDRAAAAATLLLALLAAGVLAPLAASAPGRSAVVPTAALASFGAVAFLPHATPLPAAAVSAVLAAALGAALAERRRWAAVGARPGPALGAVLGWVLAAQLAARVERLWLAPSGVHTLVAIVAVPLGVGLALALVARRWPAGAAVLGLASYAAGPGWGRWAALAVVAGAAVCLAPPLARRPRWAAGALLAAVAVPSFARLPAWLALALLAVAAAGLAPAPRLARAGTATLAAAALAALVAGSLPWLRPAPLAALVAATVAPPFRLAAAPLGTRPVVLTVRQPSFEAPAALAAARGVLVYSYLTDAAALPCELPLARIELWHGERRVATAILRAGRDSADWAARRPDVAPTLACPAPPPAWSWLPAGGRFLGTTYRARARFPAAVAADRLRLERAPELPNAVGVAFFFVGVER